MEEGREKGIHWGRGGVDIGAFPGSSGRYSALENEKQFSFIPAPWMRKGYTDKMPRRNDGKISEFPFVSLLYILFHLVPSFASLFSSLLFPTPFLSLSFLRISRLTIMFRLCLPRTELARSFSLFSRKYKEQG